MPSPLLVVGEALVDVVRPLLARTMPGLNDE